MGAILADKGDKGAVTIYMSHMYWNTNSPCHHFTHEKLSTWLFREMQIKTKKITSHLSQWLLSKGQEIMCWQKNMEKGNICLIHETENWGRHYGK